MAILDLEAMARYGAYARHLDQGVKFQIPKFLLPLNDPIKLERFTGIEFFGGTANFKQPIQPVGSEKALQIAAFQKAADKGGKTEIRIFNPADNTTPYTKERFTLTFEKKPTSPLVSVVPDITNKFSVQTDRDAGAEVFKQVERLVSSSFTFQPGAKQEFNYTTSSGVDVGYSVTEGISKTTSEGGSNTTTVGVEIGGSFKGIDIGAKIEQSWTKEWSQSQTIDFSSTNTKVVSKSNQTSATVDLGTIQPNAKGKYFYGNVELVPGKKYQISIIEEVATLKTPITGTFIISPTSAENTDIKSSFTFPIFGNVLKDELFENESFADAASSIYEAYKTYNYDALVAEDLANRAWSLESNPSRLFMSLTNGATFTSSTNLDIEVRPVATPQTQFADDFEGSLEGGISPVLLQSEVSESMRQGGSVTRIFLDEFNTSNGIPGVAFDLNDFSERLNQDFVISGTSEGGDFITINDNNTSLVGFKNSVIEVKGGYNKFDDASGNGFNQYFLDNGFNMLYLQSDSNFINSAGGLSLIDADRATQLNVDSGLGKEILKVSSADSDIFFSDWDFQTDTLIFGKSINLKDVRIIYESGTGNYQVSIGDRVVAVLDAKDDSLPAFDSVTGQYQGATVQPFAFADKDRADFVVSLYAAALDRLPSASELMRHESDIQSGATRASVVETILTSSEFITELATDREYVAGVYRTLLGKDPSRSQLRKSVNRLEDGMQRASFVDSVLNRDKFADFFDQELPLISLQELGIF